MELIKIVTAIGLLINLLGTIMIFYYGISPLMSKDGGTYLYNNEEHKKRQSARLSYEYRAKAGLVLAVVGGFIQIIAVIFF
jgi:hypothetical protein